MSYSLNDIMKIYQETEMPQGKDLYGWNKFAVEKRNAVDRYTWRLEQITRIGVQDFMFEKKSITPKDLADFRLGGFHSLLVYYKQYLTEDNFLTCEQAKIKYVIFANRFVNNDKLEAIKENIRNGALTETNIIGFEKNGVQVIHDGTARALAITQMLKAGERVSLTIHYYVHALDSAKRYPYIDYYPGNVEDIAPSKFDFK